MKTITSAPKAIHASALRRGKAVALAMLFAFGISALAAAPAPPLPSPWDGKPVAATETAYPYPTIDHIASDLTTDGFYRLDDPTHSIIDPVRQAAYNKSSNPVKAAGIQNCELLAKSEYLKKQVLTGSDRVGN